ncbi:hypothetical protein [Massilia aerilata]|uniref:PD(D/E)XK endonuclease domain-containing protein n=1 Tax=Massilia aerilata TaxID=453817 RepID=A0ABW0S2W6_9BURK
MDYIGRYGEYRVLAKLLELEVEAYLALKTNQEHYDITAILPERRVVRIQVKSTTLGNTSTNNSFGGVEKDYDYLVVVIIDSTPTMAVKEGSETPSEDLVTSELRPRFFVLERAEALQIKGESKLLGVSQQKNKKYFVKEAISKYEDAWLKIIAS